jgi:hypothetical protein
MANALFDPKQQGAEFQHPEPHLQDLTSDAASGPGFDRIVPRPQEHHSRTAYDVKEARHQLVGWSDDELRQIPLMPVGVRLEPGAIYVDLREPARREFTATAEMRVPTDGLYVPKSEVDRRAWYRLLGLRTAERIVTPTQAGGAPR